MVHLWTLHDVVLIIWIEKSYNKATKCIFLIAHFPFDLSRCMD
jgi:hypothetical protein